MNNLLLLFALPVATIVLAIVLQKILNNPLLVAATFFAIYLVVAFSAFDSSFLVYTIAYTILAYITAVLVRMICNLLRMIANQKFSGRSEDLPFFSPYLVHIHKAT